MSEQVQTGGVMQFRYERGRQFELDPERKDAIETGYAESDARKKREKKNKMIIFLIILILLTAAIAYFALKK